MSDPRTDDPRGDTYARQGRRPNRWLLLFALVPYVAAVAGAAYLGCREGESRGVVA